MNTEPAKNAKQLGDYAYQAVQKHFKKSVKYEKEVLTDKGPEPLHQMRVGMRRLRTALQVFAPTLDLPKTVNTEQVKKIAQVLGNVRDLDVLKTKLEERYRPDLEGKEQKQLDEVLDNLQQQRRHHFAQMEKTLKGDRYRQFKQGFNTWLKAPHYGTIAPLPILPTLPDLLLPLISRLLLHPGWLVGAQSQSGELQIINTPSTEAIRQWLDCDAEDLHDLRKQMKQVRYQTEFFVEFYDFAYNNQVKEFQTIQEVLGEIQDYSVLKEFLAAEFKAGWRKELPTLAQRLEHEQTSLWKNWQPLQKRYLDPGFRHHLRQLVLTPQGAEAQRQIVKQ